MCPAQLQTFVKYLVGAAILFCFKMKLLFVEKSCIEKGFLWDLSITWMDLSKRVWSRWKQILEPYFFLVNYFEVGLGNKGKNKPWYSGIFKQYYSMLQSKFARIFFDFIVVRHLFFTNGSHVVTMWHKKFWIFLHFYQRFSNWTQDLIQILYLIFTFAPKYIFSFIMIIYHSRIFINCLPPETTEVIWYGTNHVPQIHTMKAKIWMHWYTGNTMHLYLEVLTTHTVPKMLNFIAVMKQFQNIWNEFF